MKFAFPPRLAASLATLLLWALVAVSALYWVWRVRTPPLAQTPLAGNTVDAGQVDAQAVARGLGAADGQTATGATDMNGRFALRGVVTHGAQAGTALIAVDGKSPRPVPVGAEIDGADGWTLRAVTPGGAVLAGGARELTLAVPQPVSRQDAYSDIRANIPPDARAPATMPPAMPPPPRLMNPPRAVSPLAGTGGQNSAGAP